MKIDAMKIDTLLSELRQRDVKLWVEDDRLRYRAAKDALTPELLGQMKDQKAAIIAFLQGATASISAQLPPISSIDRHAQLSLSFAQQRLWFLQQFEPDSSSSNMPVVVQITGQLEVEILERSIAEVVRRHEVLRTTFPSVDGQPTLVVAPPAPVHLPLVDLREVPIDRRDAEALQIATEEARTPFNLETGPTLRVKLLRLNDREHLFIWNLHCIVCDGASSDVFYQNLTAVYTAFSLGKPSPLADLSVQYLDFAHWQRQWLQGEVLESQLSYWKQKLENLPALLQLPTDYVRPVGVQTYRGDRAARMLPKVLNDALNALGQQLGVTLFMTLLAAFEVLLYRYSGQEDMLISFASAGRGQVETEGLIGFFSNTLLLRTDFAGNPTFRELLHRVRKDSLEAYTYQDLPFEKLIEELRPEQNQTRSPLFQIKFALNPPWSNGRGMASVHLPDLIFTSLFGYIYPGKTKYDLTLVMREQDEGLGYVFDYNAELFDVSTIARMLDHFQNLLEGIVANPDRRLSELPLLTATERQQLLYPRSEQIAHPQPVCVYRLFEAQVEKSPDAIALVAQDIQLTYQELNCRANQLAHYLLSLGVTPESLVGICVERSPDAIVALLGILKAGGICVPLHPDDSPEQLAHVLEDAQVLVVLTQKAIAQRLDCHAKVICLDSDRDAIQQQPQASPSYTAPLEQLAYLLYVTHPGRPIAVSITHQNLAQINKSIEVNKSVEDVKPAATDVFLQFHPLTSEVAMFEIWGSLLNGAKLIIFPASLQLLGQVLQQHQVTTAWLPTRLLHQMVSRQPDHLRSLRQLFTGGDALSVAIVQKLLQGLPNCQLIYGYSRPENTGLICSGSVTAAPASSAAIPIGRAMADTQVYILDNHHQPVAIGSVGNLYVSGDRLAQGYFNCPELTASEFIAHPFSQRSGASLYKTGDLARYLPDGAIELVGYADVLPAIYGLRVEIGRIETALSQHPAVQEALVLMLPLSRQESLIRQESLTAYVVLHLNQAISILELRDFLRQKVAAHMIPSTYVILDLLPLTPQGTVDYLALPLPDPSHQIETAFVAAQDELELKLTQIWEATLGLQPIGVTDNFFDLGGHSLLAVRLFAQIEAALGRNLPLSILLKAPTIEELAVVIRQNTVAEAWSPLVELQKGDGSKPPLFFVHGGGFNILVYRDLALNLGIDQSVYALQARGLDGDSTRISDRLEEIATDYVQQIQTVQPQGPYFLGGLSNGGNIALEMAQQLSTQGETIGLLALMDTYRPNSIQLLPPLLRLLSSLRYVLQNSLPRFINRTLGQNPQTVLVEMQKRLSDLKTKASHPSDHTSETLIRTQQSSNINQSALTGSSKLDRWMDQISQYVLDHSPWSFFLGDLLKEVEGSMSETLTKLEQVYNKAHKAYVPKIYSGKITLFRASESAPGFYVDPQLGWGNLAAKGVEVHKIPGHHTSIMKSLVLAKKMRSCLELAQLKNKDEEIN